MRGLRWLRARGAGAARHCARRRTRAREGRRRDRRRVWPPAGVRGLRRRRDAVGLRGRRRVRRAARRCLRRCDSRRERRGGRRLRARQLRRRSHELFDGLRRRGARRDAGPAPRSSPTTWRARRRTRPASGAAWRAWCSRSRSPARGPRRAGALDDVAAVARRAADATRSIGVALSPCLIPGAAAPGFTLGDDEIELGMGIHGEPGVERRPSAAADEVAE